MAKATADKLRMFVQIRKKIGFAKSESGVSGSKSSGRRAVFR